MMLGLLVGFVVVIFVLWLAASGLGGLVGLIIGLVEPLDKNNTKNGSTYGRR